MNCNNIHCVNFYFFWFPHLHENRPEQKPKEIKEKAEKETKPPVISAHKRQLDHEEEENRKAMKENPDRVAGSEEFMRGVGKVFKSEL